MKANYHTHTTRCLHAVGCDEAYVQAAIAAGFDILGFSDHAPWPFRNGYVSGIRMPLADLDDYIASVQALKASYAGRIRIPLGLESEYFPRYRDHLLRMRERGVSYYILGQHYADSEEENPYIGLECRDDDGVRRYAESLCRAMETGLFCYVAHPDLFMRHRTAEQFSAACEEAAAMICQTALACGMPLEYNLLGLDTLRQGKFRGYPAEPFWEAAKKYNNPVILGVDAHDPANLADASLWELGRKNVLDMGYTLVDHISIEEE